MMHTIVTDHSSTTSVLVLTTFTSSVLQAPDLPELIMGTELTPRRF